MSEPEEAFWVQTHACLRMNISGIPFQKEIKHVRTWSGSSVETELPEKRVLSSAQQGAFTRGVITSALPHPASVLCNGIDADVCALTQLPNPAQDAEKSGAAHPFIPGLSRAC